MTRAIAWGAVAVLAVGVAYLKGRSDAPARELLGTYTVNVERILRVHAEEKAYTKLATSEVLVGPVSAKRTWTPPPGCVGSVVEEVVQFGPREERSALASELKLKTLDIAAKDTAAATATTKETIRATGAPWLWGGLAASGERGDYLTGAGIAAGVRLGRTMIVGTLIAPSPSAILTPTLTVSAMWGFK